MRIDCDFHMHSEHSLDGRLPPAEMVRIAKERGLSAIAISDHNTFAGSKEAMALGDTGVLIIPSVEYATELGHILALFLTRELPEEYLRPLDDFHFEFDRVIDGIHACGGLAVFAHPFKSKARTGAERDIFDRVDGIEVFNGRAAAKFNHDANEKACRAAEELGLFFTAGSDSHTAPELGNARLTLEVEELTLEEVRRALLEKKGTVWGRNAKVLHCARSAFTKWKKKRAFRRYPKAVLYLIGAWGLDLLKRIGLVRGNQGRYFVREGVFVDDTH